MKLKWERPQLVSLYRGKPEEKVLCGCKRMNGGGPHEAYNHQCDAPAGHCNICQYGESS